ncbi:MAG: hypothetical protein K2O33_07400, partial [Muribaculaceae bacterium]|nr:hypothetical protein [Muribaculaceae bacterium]
MSDRLVGDCGSNKCAWAMLRADGSGERFVSAGMNPAVLDRAVLESLLREGLSGLGRPGDVGEVWFYGAGCAGEGAERMRSALARLLPGADVEVSSDLLGAARALFGDAAGVACILGTGSNSGYYDGREIVRNVRPMGFIIGDEGSGASIGRTVLNQYYKGWLDESTRAQAEELLELIKADARPENIVRSFSYSLAETEFADSLLDARHSPLRAGLRLVSDRGRGHDSLSVRDSRRTLLIFTDEHSRRSDSVSSLVKTAGSRAEVKIADISFDSDTVTWRRSIGDASEDALLRFWAQGAAATPGLEPLRIGRLPFFVLCDSTARIIYRGSSASAALRATR